MNSTGAEYKGSFFFLLKIELKRRITNKDLKFSDFFLGI